MKRTVRVLTSILGVILLVGAAGCQRENAGKRHIFGATYMTRNNPYFDVLNAELEEEVEANGDKLIVRNPLQDQRKQNQQIQDMIEEGMEVLFLNPVDQREVKPALEACKEAGVAIINVDAMVADRQYVLGAVETDHYQAGQLCAENMMKHIKSGRIIVLNNPGMKSISERVRGFTDAIAHKPEYKVIRQENGNGEIEVASSLVSDILGEEQDFDVIFGGNDPMALGALAALQKAGIAEGVLIYGVDGSPDFKAMVQEGYVTGTSSQSPEIIAHVAAEMGYSCLKGQKVEKYVKIPSTLITRENLDEFDIDGWQ
ncbi:sugar ABC transporter substrate-binding protein [Clostridium sp. C105KSO13]|uniref:sugar ABC transporter substrate-binding protein n=1 Tax=Clostridium sp. C105KSO13 TaxID=1776045 RepID=UPI00074084F6|nr:sugar ABC transporter substrate-binding protein [Clostridium sp. C105KSO13]CUX37776.1 D-ribose-binding periplasmic protein precursor [Clostridium sp. C105KSO13]